MHLQKIEIDFDIHKVIEAERRSFEEPPYVVLRRLLKMPLAETLDTQQLPAQKVGRPFIADGVSIPHGSLARMEYQRGQQVFEGQFLDGELVVEDKSFSSLSAAASALAVTKQGSKTRLDGWLYWQAKLPNESKWRPLSAMRDALNK